MSKDVGQRLDRRFRSRTRLSDTRHRFRSRWRRWLAGPLLLIFVVGACTYYYYTRPARLIGITQRYLSELTRGNVVIGDASFSLFDGIRLTKVAVYPPGDRAHGQNPIFNCDSLHLRHDPLAAVQGRLEASEIVARNARLNLIADSQTGKLNAAGLLNRTGTDSLSGERLFSRQHAAWPKIQLPNAAIMFYHLDGQDKVLTKQTHLDVWAFQRRAGSNIYHIGWRDRQARTGPGRAKLNMLTGSMQFEPGSKPPWLPVDFVIAAMPVTSETMQRWISLLDIRGDFQIGELAIGPEAGPLRATGQIELQNAELSVPIDTLEESLNADQRFFAFNQVRGWVTVTPKEVRAEFTGDLRGRVCRVQLIANDIPAGASQLTEVGWDLIIQCDDFELLRNDPLKYPYDVRVIEKWILLKKLYEKYSPEGAVRLSCELTKPSGREAVIQLKRATFEILRGQMKYFQFPYLITDLTGKIAVTENHHILLEDLIGRNGPARIMLRGSIEGITGQPEVNIRITADNAQLDSELYDALQPQHQRAWDMFQLAGSADLDIRVYRPTTDVDAQRKLKVVIEVNFRNASATYSGFPFPFRNIEGSMTIDKEVRVTELTGHNGDGKVTVNGFVDPRAGSPVFDLAFVGRGLALSPELGAALPAERQAVYDRLNLRGTFDLSGRVYRSSGQEDIAFDFQAQIRDTSLKDRHIPYGMTDCRSTVHICRNLVEILDFSGRHGNSDLTGSARFDLEAQQSEIAVESKQLILDEALWQCLPERQRRLVKSFNPQGTIAIDLKHHSRGLGTQRQTSFEANIQPQNNHILSEHFPVPLSAVQGRILATEQEVRLIDLSATYETAKIQVQGVLAYAAERPYGQLQAQIREAAFSQQMLHALPEPLRRVTTMLNPHGQFDLQVDALDIVFGDREKPASWELTGELQSEQVQLDAGVLLRDVIGPVRFNAQSGMAPERTRIEAMFDLESAAMNKLKLHNIQGKFLYDQCAGFVAMTDLKADAYDGTATGSLIIDLKQDTPRYDAVCRLTGADLSPLLKDRTSAQEWEQAEAQGELHASLALNGPLGDVSQRRGWGQIRIDQAQMYKLPILLAILNVINLAIPEEGAFQDCEFHYEIDGEVMHIQDILLKGTALTLAGDGTLNLSNQEIDLTLITLIPHQWPKIPLLADVIEGAWRELIELQLEGPIANPHVRARPLRRLGQLLNRLFKQTQSNKRR